MKLKFDFLKDESYKKEFFDVKNKLENNYNDKKENVDSEFFLLIKLFFLFSVYLIKLPFVFISFFLSLFLSKSNRKENYFRKIFIEPFLILNEIKIWFFQARYTLLILSILWIIFIFDKVLGLNISQNFMTHSSHLFLNIHTNLTSIFFHLNLTHIISNSIVFLFFGRIVEKYLREKIFLIFLIGGFLSNYVSNLIVFLLFEPSYYYFSIGASGAIASILIFAVFLNPFYFFFGIPIFLISWVLILMDIVGITNPSQTNNLAHICGYLSLLFVIFFLKKEDKLKIKRGLIVNASLFIIAFIFIFIFDLNQLIFNFVT